RSTSTWPTSRLSPPSFGRDARVGCRRSSTRSVLPGWPESGRKPYARAVAASKETRSPLRTTGKPSRHKPGLQAAQNAPDAGACLARPASGAFSSPAGADVDGPGDDVAVVHDPDSDDLSENVWGCEMGRRGPKSSVTPERRERLLERLGVGFSLATSLRRLGL